MNYQYHELHHLKVNMVSLLCNPLHISKTASDGIALLP